MNDGQNPDLITVKLNTGKGNVAYDIFHQNLIIYVLTIAYDIFPHTFLFYIWSVYLTDLFLYRNSWYHPNEKMKLSRESSCKNILVPRSNQRNNMTPEGESCCC